MPAASFRPSRKLQLLCGSGRSAFGRCNQLSGLERSHGLAGTCGVPDVAAALLVILPFRLGNGIRNFAGSVVLIAAHHLQNAIGTIGNGIKAHQHMRHRDRQKCRSKSGRSEPCRRYSPCHGTVLLRCSIVKSRTKCNSVPKEPAVLPPIALHAGIHVLDYSANMGSTFHSGHLPLLLRYWVASSCRSPQILAISVIYTLMVLIIDYLRAKRKSVSTFAALLDIGVIL